MTPTSIDALPPELDADFATRIGGRDLIHVECQGYHDASFLPRALWYHVGFALRHRGRRRIRTVAIWLTRPPKGQPRNHATVDDITVRLTTIVLRDVGASRLFAHPATACFAGGANAEGLSDDELCARVALALRERKASWAERHMAVVAALSRGRYHAMVKAMEEANLEPVIIEDLVRFGEDRGRAEGRAEGREEGRKKGREEGRRSEARDLLRLLLTQRKLTPSAAAQRKIDACDDLETLHRWLRQAVEAKTAAAALR